MPTDEYRRRQAEAEVYRQVAEDDRQAEEIQKAERREQLKRAPYGLPTKTKEQE